MSRRSLGWQNNKVIKICGPLDLLKGINEQATRIVVSEGVYKDLVALLFGFTTYIGAYCSSD